MYPDALHYLFNPPSYSDFKLSRSAVGLLQPWSPRSHGPGCKKASPLRYYAEQGGTFHTVRLDSKMSCQYSRQQGVWIVDNSCPESFNASFHFFVLAIDCKCKKRRPSLFAPDGALREATISRSACGYVPPGANSDHSLPPGRRKLLPGLPLLLRRWRSDLSLGTSLSLTTTVFRSPARAVR